MEISEHLFRRESGKMVATLTRIFGVQNLALAEDVVQDAFCRALETWKYHGVPANPSAWLMTTAKNRALDLLRREQTAIRRAPELAKLVETETAFAPGVDHLFAQSVIKDDQLRMMFACCNPRLSEDAQVALVLHMLCGFSAAEIAGAFMSSRDAIEKRITRAKKALASSKRLFDLADADLAPRLASVHRALYLLFNEGYHGASSRTAVRAELCGEARRLTLLLVEHPRTSTPTTFALAALVSLHAARLSSRVDDCGNLSPLVAQDRSRWDLGLIAEGTCLLNRSAAGTELTTYHVEAGIAALHAAAPSAEETDWGGIVWLYDTLMMIRPSPVIALNRAIAIGQHETAQRGLEAIFAIENVERLNSYPFYHAALGEFELRSGRLEIARRHFNAACECARNDMERQFLETRMAACEVACTRSDGGLPISQP